jgi:hypothetical protein
MVGLFARREFGCEREAPRLEVLGFIKTPKIPSRLRSEMEGKTANPNWIRQDKFFVFLLIRVVHLARVRL